jgi:hypothetical protein
MKNFDPTAEPWGTRFLGQAGTPAAHMIHGQAVGRLYLLVYYLRAPEQRRLD